MNYWFVSGLQKVQPEPHQIKWKLSKCTISHSRNQTLTDCRCNRLQYCDQSPQFCCYFNWKVSSTKCPIFLFFKIFYLLIVKQIEAFQRSGIQLEKGNLERSFIMWCSLDYNLHQLEFHEGHSEYWTLPVLLYQENSLAANFLINTGELGVPEYNLIWFLHPNWATTTKVTELKNIK